jgi:hypothetical protein
MTQDGVLRLRGAHETIENVNKRRQELEMGTLEKYLANATEAHKKMNEKN